MFLSLQTIPLREPTTVTEAIAMAGAPYPIPKPTAFDNSESCWATDKMELTVNLQDIVRKKSSDLLLQPGDIIEVSVSGTKKIHPQRLQRDGASDKQYADLYCPLVFRATSF